MIPTEEKRRRTYLAIPRQFKRRYLRSTGAALSAPSATDKFSPAKDALLTHGFRKVENNKSASLKKRTYLPMEAIDSYALRGEEKDIARVAESLSEEYFVVPDFGLELPIPLATNRRVRSRLYSNDIEWPDISGIAKAKTGENQLDGSGVTVAVLDTGIDCGHREFRRRPVDFRYVPLNDEAPIRQVHGFDPNGHGTHVCGILAGERLGVAPGVDLHVASVIESETAETSLVRITKALNAFTGDGVFSKDGPKILSLSLGFLEEAIEVEELQYAVEAVRQLLRGISELSDVLVIAAVGNDGEGTVRLPGCYPEVLSVGAVDDEIRIAEFSSSGSFEGVPAPHVVGFGVEQLSSLERSSGNKSLYVELSGTSMAAPYVAGVAALYAQAEKNLEGADLRRLLVDTALQPGTSTSSRYGAGLVRFDSS